MTTETMNPAAGDTASGARKALLSGEPFDPITTEAIEHPAVGRQRLRAKLETVIDRLIVALDGIDGDPDLEPGGDDEPDSDREPASDDEPSLSGVTFATTGGSDDREDGCDDEGFDCDREPEEGGL
ncbi:MAG: hypothetical protein K2X25_04895 [Caulobacteraceae bacterium]|nr:hypothetical protein [Caulobacteraceae bacterium]